MKKFLAVAFGFASLLTGGKMVFSGAHELEKIEVAHGPKPLKPFEKLVEIRRERALVGGGVALVFAGVAALGYVLRTTKLDQNRNDGASEDHPRRRF